MTRSLVPVLIMGIGLSIGCMQRYTVVKKPERSFAAYGDWDVPPLEIPPHILEYFSDQPNWENWKKEVRDAATYIAYRTRVGLLGKKRSGLPLRVRMRFVEFKPARGFGSGLFGSSGLLRVEAEFIDKRTGQVIGKCIATNDPVRSTSSRGHRQFYEDIARRVVEFVGDHMD